MKTAAASLLVAIIIFSGCTTYRPDYPMKSDVSPHQSLPIDGLWENNMGVRIHINEGKVIHEKGLLTEKGRVIIHALHQENPAVFEGIATVYNTRLKKMAKGTATVTQPYRNCIRINITHSEPSPMVCDVVNEFYLIKAVNASSLSRSFDEGKK